MAGHVSHARNETPDGPGLDDPQVARVPSQAIPLFGTYLGNREDELGMNVEVNVKTASALL